MEGNESKKDGRKYNDGRERVHRGKAGEKRLDPSLTKS